MAEYDYRNSIDDNVIKLFMSIEVAIKKVQFKIGFNLRLNENIPKNISHSINPMRNNSVPIRNLPK